jgi:hypothetical protein
VVTDHNEFGAIAFEPESYPSHGPALLRASTQLFQNGEVWSLNAALIARGPEPGHPSGLKYPFLPSLMFERVYYDRLRYIATFATKELGLSPPWNVEFGLTGVQGSRAFAAHSRAHPLLSICDARNWRSA